MNKTIGAYDNNICSSSGGSASKFCVRLINGRCARLLVANATAVRAGPDLFDSASLRAAPIRLEQIQLSYAPFVLLFAMEQYRITKKCAAYASEIIRRES